MKSLLVFECVFCFYGFVVSKYCGDGVFFGLCFSLISRTWGFLKDC